jgi:hypothetical protein
MGIGHGKTGQVIGRIRTQHSMLPLPYREQEAPREDPSVADFVREDPLRQSSLNRNQRRVRTVRKYQA